MKKSSSIGALGSCKRPARNVAIRPCNYASAGVDDSVGRLRNRTSRLMFWVVAAKKNCARTNFNPRSWSRWSPMCVQLFSLSRAAELLRSCGWQTICFCCEASAQRMSAEALKFLCSESSPPEGALDDAPKGVAA